MRFSTRAATGGWARAAAQQTRGVNLSHNHALKNIFKGAAPRER